MRPLHNSGEFFSVIGCPYFPYLPVLYLKLSKTFFMSRIVSSSRALGPWASWLLVTLGNSPPPQNNLTCTQRCYRTLCSLCCTADGSQQQNNNLRMWKHSINAAKRRSFVVVIEAPISLAHQPQQKNVFRCHVLAISVSGKTGTIWCSWLLPTLTFSWESQPITMRGA